MPSKSINQVKKYKAFKTIAVCAMVFLFVASLLLAIVLPFVNTVGVAEALTSDDFPVQSVHLGDLGIGSSVGVTVYGLWLPNGFVDTINTNFSGVTNATASFEFTDDSDLLGYLYIDLINVANGDFKVSFYYQYDAPDSNAPMTLLSCEGGDYYGLEYIIFNKPFTFNTNYSTDRLTDYMAETIYAMIEPYAPTPYTSSQFSNRFVTPYDYACQDVYFNLGVEPTYPQSSSVYIQYSPGSFYFDYFNYPMSMANSPTLRWYILPMANEPNTYYARLLFGIAQPHAFIVYSCKLSGSNLSEALTSVRTEGKWHVSGNMPDVDNQVYKYTLTNQDRYFALINNSSNAPVIDEHLGNSTWGKWLALADIYNLPMLDNNLTYNAGFDSGYQTGYDKGALDGNQTGFNQGYSEGSSVGYNKGYSAGINDSNQYTFMSLIGAVFDAPISAFRGLFNFEILGVNMTAFVSSLFALAVIVVIIKIALGGGK